MQFFTGILSKAFRVTAALPLTLGLIACEKIFDHDGDCDPWIRLVYDINMKYANASPSEVKEATVYVFDTDGVFVRQYSAGYDALRRDGWKMQLKGLDRSDYQYITWCSGTQGQTTYDIPDMTPGVSRMEELTCRMGRTPAPGDTSTVKEVPSMYHGMGTLEEEVHFFGADTAEVHLTKDMNYFRVMLQELLDNSVMDVNDYRLVITDDNGLLAHDNTPLADEPLKYVPFYTTNASASQVVKSCDEINVAIAEFTTNRLYLDKAMANRLTIYNSVTSEIVLSIPLNTYLCLVKGHYRADMPDQEYLDRQDDWQLTFFLQGGKWLSSQIIINSWKVVINNDDF